MMPENLKGYVEGIKKELSDLPIVCRFVERDNLHVCLSFLGEVSDDKIESVSKNLDSICKGFSGFEVAVGGMKIIPNENYIRVLALDIIDETGTIGRLAREIQKGIGGDSHPPHLTLCRVKSIRDRQSAVQKIKSIKVENVVLSISSIQLIKSELRKTGPVYSSIYDAKLL